MSKPIRILCVDDNFLVSEAVKIRLRNAGGFKWLGSLASADELVAETLRLQPDVLLLDIDMPGRDVFEALRELREAGSPARAIMFSGHARPDLLDRAFEAGAWGYISKMDDHHTFIDAILKVVGGEVVLGPYISEVATR